MRDPRPAMRPHGRPRAALRTLALAAAVAVPAAEAGADLDTALDALRREDWKTARAELASLAEAGEPIAQYNYGVLFQKGLGGPADLEAAVHWLEKAARQRVDRAAFALGMIYARNDPPDLEDAYVWFRLASRLGHDDARKNLYPVGRHLTSHQLAEARERADALYGDR